jgi:hypothetical protein
MSTFLLSWLFLLAAPGQQTTTPNPADLCTIQGVVIKAGTARITLSPYAMRRGSSASGGKPWK